MSDVLLINMPFGSLNSPSIGLGLLKAGLNRTGISCEALSLNVRFAEMMGPEGYTLIENRTYPEHLVGEWVFSESLFNDQANRDLEDYARVVLSAHEVNLPDEPIYEKKMLDEIIVAIEQARAKVDDFLRECVDQVVAHHPKVVGFTSMFEQHIASISLAKLIKLKLPECFIIFGGPNCEGIMGIETQRQFGFIDVVVSGEADLIFPELVQSIMASNTIPMIQGVSTRLRARLPISNQPIQNTPLIHDLDSLPIPDYDYHYAALSESSLRLSKKPVVLFETSRGCWWGEKQHCTFCGLNGSSMTFRSKSGERALDELMYLSDRYPDCTINAVDNILDMKYFKTFVKFLADRKTDFGLFYEVKANLKKEQVKLLWAGGIKTIQPGIESFSDNVLSIMRKGVSALQNIQLLKWCTELGLKVIYNIIWGFPGESSDDYETISELIPLLTHLTPPIGSGNIRIDRFSPNFNNHRELGFGNISPYPAYHYVYPFEPHVVFNLAYFFSAERQDSTVRAEDAKRLLQQIKHWTKAHANSDLFFIDKGAQLLIWDLRPIAKETLVVLEDDERLAYLACDEAMTPHQVHNLWAKSLVASVNVDRLREILDSLVNQSLMIRQGDQYLSLAYQKTVAVS